MCHDWLFDFQSTELKKKDPPERMAFGNSVEEDIAASGLTPEEYVQTMMMTDQSTIVLGGGTTGRTMVCLKVNHPQLIQFYAEKVFAYLTIIKLCTWMARFLHEQILYVSLKFVCYKTWHHKQSTRMA